MADPLDGKVTDNTHKKYDPDEPIHRINSPAFNTGQFTRANGDGISRGCRPSGVSRAVTSWVSVNDDDFKEIEGKIVRSYQTWTDIPLAQWHKWYDWNFHIIPTDPYQYVRGEGNEEPQGTPGTTPVVPGRSMECEWDVAAFGNRSNNFKFGPMFERDWAWPMATQFAWVAGRWVYDCSHANKQGKMRSEIHPIGAVASARWEAVKFQSAAQVLFPVTGALGIDTPFMPAVQFMFFASRLGGYLTTPKTFERDYEFIVDLPKETAGRTIVPIGSTPEHSRNTITLGPLRIVAQFDFAPFSNAQGSVNSSVQPILSVITPADGSFPSQVKVTIPLIAVRKAGADAYGVVISIGLVDQFLDLAKRILLVSGSFDEIQFFNRDFGDVAVKFGINGRWHREFFRNVKQLDKKKFNRQFSFALSLDHPANGGGPLLFSCHGKIMRRVGKLMDEPEADRILHLGNAPSGRVYQWEFDILSKDSAKMNQLEVDFSDRQKATLDIATQLPEENEPLGVADVARRAKELALGEVPFQLNGKAVEDLPGLAELVFKKAANPSLALDYILSGKITAKAQ